MLKRFVHNGAVVGRCQIKGERGESLQDFFLRGWKYFDLEVDFMCAGMEISAEQRKLAIVNARRAKQGKNKSKEIFKFSDFFFFVILTVIWIFVLFLVCPFYSHWLLWFCPTASPNPSPTSPTSYHHSNQCPSAAGLFTGRAPKTKTLSPVVQHHPKCLFQKMRPLSPLRSRREKV